TRCCSSSTTATTRSPGAARTRHSTTRVFPTPTCARASRSGRWRSGSSNVGETVTIYHNPRCSKSRQTLELIRSAGIEPRVVEYLKTPPSREELADLVRRMGIRPRDILRSREDVAGELGLRDPSVGDDALLDAMAANPILIERPIVVSDKGVRLGRPPEAVLDVLPKKG